MPCGNSDCYPSSEELRQQRMEKELKELNKKIDSLNVTEQTSSNNQKEKAKPKAKSEKELCATQGMLIYDSVRDPYKIIESSKSQVQQSNINQITQENKEMRLLCDVLTHLEQTGRFVEIINKCKYSKKIKDWWENHKKTMKSDGLPITIQYSLILQVMKSQRWFVMIF